MSRSTRALTVPPGGIPPGEACNDCAARPATRTVTVEMAGGDGSFSRMFHLHFCAACHTRWNHERLP